ncbi:hypothetical protein [Candidatus Avelusimicrobium sp.]
MTMFKKIFNLILSFSLLFSTCALSAQVSPYAQNPFVKQNSLNLQKRIQFLDGRLQEIQIPQATRPEGMDLYTLLEIFDKNGFLTPCDYFSIVKDKAYIASLNAEEAELLIYLATFVSQAQNSCQENLMFLIRQALESDYDEKAEDFSVLGFYNLMSAAYARSNALAFNDVMEAALAQGEKMSYKGHPCKSLWAAELLFLLAQENYDDFGYVMGDSHRHRFERRLEGLIAKYDWVKNSRSDYVMKGIKSSDAWNISNQASLISLFIQANSALSMKEDDSLLKQMVSTGGLNFIGRGEAGRFSDQGEVFYLHHVTPGTDGKGNNPDTENGRRHVVLSRLIQALFLSYDARETQESSAKMQQFIRQYMAVNSDGSFAHYLYMPLIGMRLGKLLHNESSLQGWDREEETLQKELHQKLKSGYGWSVACSVVQGSCEVAVEWLGVGELIGGVFKILGWGGRLAGKQIARMLPAKALMDLAVVEIAGKAAIRWTRQNVKSALQRYGWKIAVGATAAAAVSSDQSLKDVSTY